eukprot:scaffold8235_cov155-Amphora_coffeaeformis.AAC.1
MDRKICSRKRSPYFEGGGGCQRTKTETENDTPNPLSRFFLFRLLVFGVIHACQRTDSPPSATECA